MCVLSVPIVAQEMFKSHNSLVNHKNWWNECVVYVEKNVGSMSGRPLLEESELQVAAEVR